MLERIVNYLYLMFITPIEYLFEFFYVFVLKVFNNHVISIIGLSVVVGIITLPLYHFAEKLQERERLERKRLEKGIQRIKSVFKGDEQYMILSTYYRQNNYHPLHALKGSVGLFIQIPFFIAAYKFLSNIEQLQGVSFFVIKDLSEPDKLLYMFNQHVNLLPIFMTMINVVAGLIYSKGFALRDKVQLFGVAALFLVLLYNSPSALVLYWTFNNIFSLAKNVFYKMKPSLFVLYVLTSCAAVIFTIALFIIKPDLHPLIYRVSILGSIGILLIPLIVKLLETIFTKLSFLFEESKSDTTKNFIISVGLLFVLFGLVIPSSLISSSVVEFAGVQGDTNPLILVVHTLLFFFGTFIIWPFVIFNLSSKAVKVLFSFFMVLLSITAMANTYLFQGDYGIVTNQLQFETPSLLISTIWMKLIPIVVFLLIVCVLLLLFYKGKGKHIHTALLLLLVGLGATGGINIYNINKDYQFYTRNAEEVIAFNSTSRMIEPVFNFSKDGKNVLFIFLDRAMSSFFPYIIEEIPELKEQLAGFVYYPNTVSFGSRTIQGSPSMFGGYEYTPDAINKRSTEKLVTKHNEALLVLPTLFMNAGYNVTLTDPPLSNYEWEADYTPFKPYPEMNVLYQNRRYLRNYLNEHGYEDVVDSLDQHRLEQYLPLFSILKSMFPIMRTFFYDGGNYFTLPQELSAFDETSLGAYSQLYYLKDLSRFDASGDVYINVSNDLPHRPFILQAPEYEPRLEITQFHTPLDDIEDITFADIEHYHANAASLKLVGRWFDQLREEGVYDNTRIIIVADHGYNLYSKKMKDFKNNGYDYNRYVPLLLMKDFLATEELSVNNEFMTNADAPLFAIKDLVDSYNPYTGKDMFSEVQKDRVNVYRGPFQPSRHRGTQFPFDLDLSFSIGEDIFIESNWRPVEPVGNQK